MTKYIGPALLVAVAILTLGGCGNRRPSAGLFIYREDDLFMRRLTGEIEDGAAGALELKTWYGRNSQSIQNEQIENALQDGSSVMIVNPVDRIGAHAVVNMLRKADVPVIFFNREPLRQDIALWDKAWYVGARAEQSGRMQAELVMELFGPDPENLNEFDRNSDGRIQCIILKGEQGHQDAEQRTEAVQTAFREKGYRLDILATEIANWNRNEAYEKMDELLDDPGGVPELILSNNDAMALGAISAMRQRGYFQDADGNGSIGREDSDWIPVLGIDGVPDAVGHIQDGYLYGTVLNDSQAMADAIVALARMLGSDDPPVSESTDDRYIWIDYKTFRLD